jgi:hypothetical protein
MWPGRHTARGLASIALAATVWLPLLHLFFLPPKEDVAPGPGVPPMARRLAARHLALWTDPALREREVARMRAGNAEWDFMGRTFLVAGLAELALRDPSIRPECLAVMDRIIDETLRIEREEGMLYFLMDYAQARPFILQPPRSQFLDGEIALMLALRRLVEERESWRAPLRERVGLMVERMERSPVLSAESYPDECWTFCNAIALAAIRAHDVLDGADHSAFLRRWVDTAKSRLIHPETGLLVSSYTLDGRAMDGPEGSSIWMVAHCLRVVDASFAADQYARAKRELARGVLGFGWAREWPPSWQGSMDVDSGPVIPVLEVSAGSSGLAFVGAASFGDANYLRDLWATLNFAAFPSNNGRELRHHASNQVGDAVLLYASLIGPVWDRIGAMK